MKRLIRIVLTTLLASSLLAGQAAADPKGDRGGRGWERRESRGEREYRGQREYRGPAPREYRGPQREYQDRGGAEWRRDRYEPADGRGRRWDDGGPAYPGPPAYSRRQPPGGYGLRRGGMAPPSYRGAIVPDYSRHRLRPPPPGFAWVRAGDRYLLISRSTGQIFDVIGE